MRSFLCLALSKQLYKKKLSTVYRSLGDYITAFCTISSLEKSYIFADKKILTLHEDSWEERYL